MTTHAKPPFPQLTHPASEGALRSLMKTYLRHWTCSCCGCEIRDALIMESLKVAWQVIVESEAFRIMADDLVDEATILLLKLIERLRAGQVRLDTHIIAFLRRMFYTRFIEHLPARHSRNRQRGFEDGCAQLKNNVAIGGGVESDVADFLARIDDPMIRQAVELRMEGLTWEEIGQLCGESGDVVKRRVRGLKDKGAGFRG